MITANRSFNLNAQRTLDTIRQQVDNANARARGYGLPDTLTVDQWLTILNYWNWTCAVCEIESHDLSPDHWLPLCAVECPGSTYDNIVPLCEGCNLSKNRTEPRVWLTKRFSEPFVEERLLKVRKALQQLMAPGNPYNTTIPEKIWLDDKSANTDTAIKQIVITFDMSIPAEADMWKKIEQRAEEGWLQASIKNIIFVTMFKTKSLVYRSYYNDTQS